MRLRGPASLLLAFLSVLCLPQGATAIAAVPPSPPAQSVVQAGPAGGKPAASAGRQVGPVMAAQRPLDLAAAQIEQLATHDHLAGYTGAALDLPSSRVLLYWHGGLPASLTALLRQLSANVTVEVRQAPYSQATLLGEARRIIGSGPTPGGAKVIEAGILPDFSGLQVTLDRPGAGLAITSAVKTVVRVGAPLRPLDLTCPPFNCPGGRWNDSPAFFGGDAVVRDAGGGAVSVCTTAFETASPALTISLLTAAHCGIDADWYTPSAAAYYLGHSGGCCQGNDVMAITKNNGLGSGDYAPYIYVGPWDDGSSTYSPVVDSGSNPLNAQRCFGGAESGEVCGNVVTSGLMYINTNFGVAGPGVWMDQMNGVDSAGSGDSGGPAYTVDPATGDITAMGLLDSIDSGNDRCSGLPASGNRQCSSRVFVVDLRSALNVLGQGLVVAKRTPVPVIVGPGCTRPGTATGTWSSIRAGDWSGSDFAGGSCNDTTLYTWSTSAPTTASYRWSIQPRAGATQCDVQAYIPTVNAGIPNARYDFWGVDSAGVNHWLGWPGYRINQNSLSGFYSIGSGVNVIGLRQFSVTLSNNGTPGWYVGAGDMKFSCS